MLILILILDRSILFCSRIVLRSTIYYTVLAHHHNYSAVRIGLAAPKQASRGGSRSLADPLPASPEGQPLSLPYILYANTTPLKP